MAYAVKEEAPAGIQKAGFMTRALTSAIFALVWLAGVILGMRWYVLPLLCLAVAVVGVLEFIQLIKDRMPIILSSVLGYLYLMVPLACFIYLRILGLFFAITLMLSIWGADTAAYLFGSIYGRHKLSPRISPKKSWEGFIAGLIISVLVWVGAYLIVGYPSTGTSALGMVSAGVIFGVLAACAGLAGDLLESYLKRRAGVKDSGTILPGHGGILDRFDSLLIAAPVVLMIVPYIARALCYF